MKSITTLACFIFAITGFSQSVMVGGQEFTPVGVTLSNETLAGKKVGRLAVRPDIQGANQPTFALAKGVDFKNGTIELKLLSRLLKDASPGARGFIGIAFRIAADNSKFECIYIRPTNGRADDQVRRNHSIQYISYPEYDFDRFRKESPEKYESYADMGLDEWITLRITVKDQQARLFINDAKQPCLIVNDLKHGVSSGGIGVWVDGGTDGFFGDLKVSKD